MKIRAIVKSVLSGSGEPRDDPADNITLDTTVSHERERLNRRAPVQSQRSRD